MLFSYTLHLHTLEMSSMLYIHILLSTYVYHKKLEKKNNLVYIFRHLPLLLLLYFNSVQFSCSVVSDSLRPHESQHARPPCPPPSPRVHSNSRPSSQWCHPTISSSVVPFSSCPQSFPATGSFQMSQLFASGGQSIGVSASTSVPPMNTQDWSHLGRTGWISKYKLKSGATLFCYFSVLCGD